ncbi:MAG: Spx/MgsR family RNA polymerase-binding regulatory protein [Bacilli bacterium]|nr:Spx/MgsR family RNA polymerase-binding regulatory protein [Bacilli bacterium]
MLKVYTSPSCSSCRKVKEWLKNKNIEYIEKNIMSSILNEKELKEILAKSENGTDDIISKRSKIIKESKVDVDKMKVPELISFIRANPTILKRPIIVNDRMIQVGYNSEEIRVFIPHELRNLINDECGPKCKNYTAFCVGDCEEEDPSKE